MGKNSENEDFLLDMILKAYQEEYQSHRERWRVLDNKAQAILTTAGIFIAATFAFVAEHYGKPEMEKLGPVIAISTGLLIVCGLCGVGVMLIRKMKTPPSGAEIYSLAIGMLDKQNNISPDDYRLSFINDQKEAWENSITTTAEQNKRKAFYLSLAQLCLLLSIISIALFTVSVLFG